MSEKRLNNTIYIMYLVTENYKKAHSLTTEQFMNLDQKYNIINFVGECPDIFDSMNNHEMVEEIDQYVAANSGLFLETDSYLNNALDIEFEKDKEALY